MQGVQQLVTIVPWTFIATICNLFIQIYLIKRFLFKPVNEMLEKRKALADAQIAQAQEANEQAQAMKAEYEQDLLEAKTKAGEILQSAQKTASDQAEQMLREANRQAAAAKIKAAGDIEQEKRKAVDEIKNEIGSMAVEIAGKVIGRELSESDHEKLIDEFISNVGEVS
ncbi:MAG: F0F1 ATP synthase subunit B [Blautia sp.]|nr:F0F1 ATP synthase subunit B [Blautia sp.]